MCANLPMYPRSISTHLPSFMRPYLAACITMTSFSPQDGLNISVSQYSSMCTENIVQYRMLVVCIWVRWMYCFHNNCHKETILITWLLEDLCVEVFIHVYWKYSPMENTSDVLLSDMLILLLYEDNRDFGTMFSEPVRASAQMLAIL